MALTSGHASGSGPAPPFGVRRRRPQRDLRRELDASPAQRARRASPPPASPGPRRSRGRWSSREAGVEGEAGERADVGAGGVAGVGDPAKPVEDRVVGVEPAGHRLDPGGLDLRRSARRGWCRARRGSCRRSRACRAPDRRRPAGRGCRGGRRRRRSVPSRKTLVGIRWSAPNIDSAVDVVNSFMFEASGRGRPGGARRRGPAGFGVDDEESAGRRRRPGAARTRIWSQLGLAWAARDRAARNRRC